MPRVEIERLAEGLKTSTGQPRASSEGLATSQSLGRELSRAGTVLQEFGLRTANRIKVARDSEYVAAATVDSNEEIIRFEKEFKKSSVDNPAGYTDAYIQQVDDIYGRAIQNAPSQESRNQLQQMFAAQRTSKLQGAMKFEEEATVNNFINTSEENLNIISNRLAENPDLLQESQLEINQLVENANEILDPKAAAKFKDFASTMLTRSVVSGLSGRGDYEQAKAFLENENVKKILSAEEIGRLESSIDRDQNAALQQEQKAATAEYNKFVDDTKAGIVRGEVTDVQLDNMFDQQAFRSTNDFLKLRNLLDRERKIQRLKVDAIQRVDASRTSGVPLNPASKEDRKMADTYYNEVIVPTTEPEELAGRTHDFITDLGVIPEGIKSNLLANLFNGTPRQVVGAATTMDRLVRSEPSLAKSFTNNKDLAMARRISIGVSSGLTPEEAVKASDEKIRLSTQTVNVRQAALTDLNPQFDQGEITSFLIDDPDEVPQEMINDWENLVTAFGIDLGMDPEDAVDLAYKRTQATWAITNVVGDEQYMKRAPEIFYGVPGRSNEWMSEQFAKDIEPFGELEDVSLRVDPESNSAQPEYIISHKVQGFEVPLVDDEGNVLTWNPDWSLFSGKLIVKAQTERAEFLSKESE